MSNPFDALRKVIEHEANQDDDGGFFARLGGLEPDPEDDGPTARGLFQHVDFTKPGTPVYAAKPGHVQAAGWNVRPGRSWNPTLGQYPPWYAVRGGHIRTARVWKPKTMGLLDSIWRAFSHPWRWHCRLCNYQTSLPSWEAAYTEADRHARNYHRSGK